MNWTDIIAWLIASATLVPFAMLTVELLAALLPSRRASVGGARPQVAVLVPAHNEEAGIVRTIANIQPQLQTHDRLLVVADNCTDRTAEYGRSSGAEVIERQDTNNRGKGFALDFGLRHLASDPPDVVVVIDADTSVRPNSIDALARTVAATGRPVQGTNLLHAPPDAGPGTRISAFAFFLKNYIRPRGLQRLDWPCLLYGTGMALPYRLMAQANLAHGDITEDIRLGIELAHAGQPPVFCPESEVFGEMPTGPSVATTQRRRWEHGHLRTLCNHVPKLFWHGITHLRFDLITLALHIGIPPLSFLFLFGAVVGCGLWLMGAVGPALTVVAVMAATVIAGLFSWLRFGRGILPWRDLAMLPVYIVSKVPLYFRFFTKPQKTWVRTERANETPRAT